MYQSSNYRSVLMNKADNIVFVFILKISGITLYYIQLNCYKLYSGNFLLGNHKQFYVYIEPLKI